jgi:hypothetical protein
MNTVAARNRCQTVRDVLIAGRQLITDRSRHCVGSLAYDRFGKPVTPDEPSAVCWCAYGALGRFAQGELLTAAKGALADAVAKQYCTCRVVRVNDGPNGHARILAAYALAIKILRPKRRVGS